MSAEKNLDIGIDSLPHVDTSQISVKVFSERVDINNLLARVRAEKQKENKTNLVFFGLISALVLIVGILLSF